MMGAWSHSDVGVPTSANESTTRWNGCSNSVLPHLQHSNTQTLQRSNAQTLQHSNAPTPQLFDGTDYSRNRIAIPLLCEHAANEQPSSACDVARRITTYHNCDTARCCAPACRAHFSATLRRPHCRACGMLSWHAGRRARPKWRRPGAGGGGLFSELGGYIVS